MTNKSAVIVFAAFCTTLIAYTIRYGYGILLPYMIQSMGISKTSAGTIYSSYFLSYTLFSPFLGWLSDKYNIRIILTVFTLMLAFGAFLMSYSTSVLNASLFFVISGIGHAACWAPVMALVQRAVADKNRGMALAITSMGSAVGIAGLGLVLPVIVSYYTWRGGWMVMGIFGFGVAMINYLLIPDFSQNSEAISPNPKDMASDKNVAASKKYGMILKNKTLWFIGISYSLVGFAVLVPYTFLSAYTTEKLNFTFTQTSRCFTVMAISGIAGKLILGCLSDIIKRVHVMMICGILLGIGCMGMGMSQMDEISQITVMLESLGISSPVGMIYLFSVVFGLGFGAVWPVYAAAAPDFFDGNISGSVIGLWTGFMGIGSILSPTLCGWTIDQTNGYTLAFTMGTVCSVASAIFLIPVIKPARLHS
ncbi:MAG: MFS transporter [Desulfamplus sp.]|nr:MFS transporter [Desulfamplus sp.]